MLKKYLFCLEGMKNVRSYIFLYLGFQQKSVVFLN